MGLGFPSGSCEGPAVGLRFTKQWSCQSDEPIDPSTISELETDESGKGLLTAPNP
jgi:hypothetical protein